MQGPQVQVLSSRPFNLAHTLSEIYLPAMTHTESLDFAKRAVVFKGLRFTRGTLRNVLKHHYARNAARGKPPPSFGEMLTDGRYTNDLLNNKRVSINQNKKNIFVNPHHTLDQREIIAHEAFHSVPVLGNSETLARFVGGYRAPKLGRPFSWDIDRATRRDKFRNGLSSVRQYTDYFRPGNEVPSFYQKGRHWLGKSLARLP